MRRRRRLQPWLRGWPLVVLVVLGPLRSALGRVVRRLASRRLRPLAASPPDRPPPRSAPGKRAMAEWRERSTRRSSPWVRERQGARGRLPGAEAGWSSGSPHQLADARLGAESPPVGTPSSAHRPSIPSARSMPGASRWRRSAVRPPVARRMVGARRPPPRAPPSTRSANTSPAGGEERTRRDAEGRTTRETGGRDNRARNTRRLPSGLRDSARGMVGEWQRKWRRANDR